MAEALHPTEGIRLLLERQEVDDDFAGARYEATIFTVTSSFLYTAALSMDGVATLEECGESASSEDLESLSKLAKSVARAAKRKQAEELPPWPPRVLRWRGPGRG